MGRSVLIVSWFAVATAGAFGQSKSPAFDVASVRPSQGAGSGLQGRRENIETAPGSLIMRNASLASCIQWAYDVKPYQLSGPGWLTDERYDIAAKTESPDAVDQLRIKL
ncbi:MAG: TIGR03435 family protein, partial [Acidobacteriia bacterium]|nr:TIGR03435 family protein [Terriglobia bacterium]